MSVRLLLFLMTVMLLLIVCSCGERGLPELWNEHQMFGRRVRLSLIPIATAIEIRRDLCKEYPQTDSDFIREHLRFHPGLVYYYPPKYTEGPFDLIWVGPNGKFEGGKGDDVPIQAVANRLCDEDGLWLWYFDETDTQMFYEKWRKYILEKAAKRK